MAKERLHYIDVAKGLLILMVVWGHYELLCRLCFNIKDPLVDTLDGLEITWVAFFMPAFFFLTGYCTNFSRPFIPFVWQSVKILLIPAIVINYVCNVAEYLSWGENPIWIAKTIGKNFLLKCAGEWFTPSLFLSRLSAWGIVKLKNKYLQIVIALTIFSGGIIL